VRSLRTATRAWLALAALAGAVTLVARGPRTTAGEAVPLEEVSSSVLPGGEARDGTAPPTRIAVDYPSDGTIFPPDLAAPTFLWHDDSDADRWTIDLVVPGGTRMRAEVRGAPPPVAPIDPRALGEANEIYAPTPYQASARAWRPSRALWDRLRESAPETPLRVIVRGHRSDDPDAVPSEGAATIAFSADPVGAPIFYRDVPLMPSKTKEGVIKPLADGAVPLIAWRLKDVGRADSRVLLESMPTCANCHSFSADGKTFGMDVDGPDGDKGAYGLVPLQPRTVIQAGQVISWNRFRGLPEGQRTLGFLSRVSPDGRHVVSTVNEQIYVQNFTDYKFSQVFYPTRGILAIYSRDTGKIEALPGADDPAFVHCDGVWSPDGRTIVFARAAATDPYSRTRPAAKYAGDPNETPIRYDLYRIPFNDGRGGKAEPIAGASANGLSNNFPKVSPDGRFIVFTRCRNGQLMRPDGELWIVPFAGGEARRMRCNTRLMNSWHSFSPNGRWLVFSSKANTPYTQMFLTHIDKDGNDSPAVLVENATASNRAVNIPEFVAVAYDEFQGITVPAVDHWRHMKAGAKLARDGRQREAIVEFEQALAGEFYDWRSNDWKTHANLSMSLMKLGDVDGALEHVRRSLALQPANSDMLLNLGYLLSSRGEHADALLALDRAVALAPKNAAIRCNRAKLRMNMGDTAGGLAEFDQALALDPNLAEAWSGRGIARSNAGDLAGARADLDRAIELAPSSFDAWYFRALARRRQNDSAGALSDLDRALALAPAGSEQRRDLEALREQIRAEAGERR